MKNNKNKYINSAIVLLILIIFSVGMYSTYPKIEEAATKNEYNVFERSDFLGDLYNSNYGIYFSILKKGENKNLVPSDIIMVIFKKDISLTKVSFTYNSTTLITLNL